MLGNMIYIAIGVVLVYDYIRNIIRMGVGLGFPVSINIVERRDFQSTNL